jgi:hypothetical protein
MSNVTLYKGINDAFKTAVIFNLLNQPFYFIFGQDQPWPDLDTPPVVTGKERVSTLASPPLIWAKATTASFITRSSCLTAEDNSYVFVDNQSWTLLPRESVSFDNPDLPTDLYLSVSIDGSQLSPITQIRYAGIVINTTLTQGTNPNLLFYPPESIEFPGNLIYLANFSPITLEGCSIEQTEFGVIINV